MIPEELDLSTPEFLAIPHTILSLGPVLLSVSDSSPAMVSSTQGSAGALESLLNIPHTSAGWAVILGVLGQSSSSTAAPSTATS